MKQNNLSFADGFNPNGQGQINRKLGKSLMAFDWDKAAEIIKEKLKLHPDLKAEAGLQGDWDYTGWFESHDITHKNFWDVVEEVVDKNYPNLLPF